MFQNIFWFLNHVILGETWEQKQGCIRAPSNTSAVHLSCGKVCTLSVLFTKGSGKFLNSEGHLSVLLYIFFHHNDWVFLHFMWFFRGALHDSRTTRGQFLFHKMAASEWRGWGVLVCQSDKQEKWVKRQYQVTCYCMSTFKKNTDSYFYLCFFFLL